MVCTGQLYFLLYSSNIILHFSQPFHKRLHSHCVHLFGCGNFTVYELLLQSLCWLSQWNDGLIGQGLILYRFSFCLWLHVKIYLEALHSNRAGFTKCVCLWCTMHCNSHFFKFHLWFWGSPHLELMYDRSTWDFKRSRIPLKLNIRYNYSTLTYDCTVYFYMWRPFFKHFCTSGLPFCTTAKIKHLTLLPQQKAYACFLLSEWNYSFHLLLCLITVWKNLISHMYIRNSDFLSEYSDLTCMS
jgi:hypothetical protein